MHHQLAKGCGQGGEDCEKRFPRVDGNLWPLKPHYSPEHDDKNNIPVRPWLRDGYWGAETLLILFVSRKAPWPLHCHHPVQSHILIIIIGVLWLSPTPPPHVRISVGWFLGRLGCHQTVIISCTGGRKMSLSPVLGWMRSSITSRRVLPFNPDQCL